MNNVIEKNKLIAEFMGYNEEIVNDEVYFTLPDMLESLSDEELHYHSDWNWLMEVVEKIENLGYGVTIGMADYCIIQNDWKEDLKEIHSLTENSKLLCTYNACVEFIKWYNQQTK